MYHHKKNQNLKTYLYDQNAMWSGQNMSNRKFMLLRLGRNFTINSICIENCTFNDYL